MKDMGYYSSLLSSFIILIAAQMGICRGGSQFITWHDLRVDDWSGNPNSNDGSRAHIILVSKDGRGDSKTVQGAVDLVPHGNKQRLKIVIFPGVYREKVTVPSSKPYISFIGKGGSETKISWPLKASDKDSVGQGCNLHAVAESYGAIAASQRNSPSDDSGFSFVNCWLKGTGMLYLGRAWGRYATVVYSYCTFESSIVPEGWTDWGDPSRRRTVWFGEYQCSGGGAESRARARWARSLNYEEAKPFLDPYYIDGHEWLSL